MLLDGDLNLFFAVRCLRAMKIAGGALQSAEQNVEVELGQTDNLRMQSSKSTMSVCCKGVYGGFEIPHTESALVRILNAMDVVM